MSYLYGNQGNYKIAQNLSVERNVGWIDIGMRLKKKIHIKLHLHKALYTYKRRK